MATQLWQNKVALVTGGNRGSGATVAKVFAGHGATVVVNYNRSREPAEQVVSALLLYRSKGADLSPYLSSAERREMLQRVDGQLRLAP